MNAWEQTQKQLLLTKGKSHTPKKITGGNRARVSPVEVFRHLRSFDLQKERGNGIGGTGYSVRETTHLYIFLMRFHLQCWINWTDSLFFIFLFVYVFLCMTFSNRGLDKICLL